MSRCWNYTSLKNRESKIYSVGGIVCLAVFQLNF